MRWIIIFLVAVVLGAGLAFLAVIGQMFVSPYGHSTSMQPVEHVIIGHRFHIPKAYINYRDDFVGSTITLKDGPGHGVFMAGITPDIAPYSEENAPVFEDQLTNHRMVRFWLWAIKYGTGLWDEYFTPEFLATCRGERLGLRVCPHPSFPKDDVILVNIDGDRKIAWNCGIPGRTVNSICKAMFPLIDHVMLEISFFDQNLPDHEAITARIFALVCGFYRPGGTSIVTYNHCEKGTYHDPTTEIRTRRRPQ